MLLRCYHAHEETYSPPIRGISPSPCAAPTTPAHTEPLSTPQAEPPCNTRLPTPKPPKHSIPQHTAHSATTGSPMATHCSATHHTQAAKGQPPKAIPRPDPRGARKTRQKQTQARGHLEIYTEVGQSLSGNLSQNLFHHVDTV